MSISRKDFKKVINLISEKHNIDSDDLWANISSIVKPSSPFSSKYAKNMANEKDIKPSQINGTGKDGKITVDDIRIFIGESPKSKKPTQWSSIRASELASLYSLNVEDFPEKERTGRIWKDGTKTISIHDVKKKADIQVSPKVSVFSSKIARKLAKDNNIDVTKIKGTGKDGKITKNDIQAYLNDENSSSSD
jgi:pyruvate/2-oxoglutarate dehydrogenase complex dihydrolipoamide acyltransferase (E2) component